MITINVALFNIGYLLQSILLIAQLTKVTRMGNIDALMCTEGCYAWAKRLPQTHKQLRILYKKNYEYS